MKTNYRKKIKNVKDIVRVGREDVRDLWGRWRQRRAVGDLTFDIVFWKNHVEEQFMRVGDIFT